MPEVESSRDVQEPSFLFVTGSMRSGTTLLSEMLYSTSYDESRHPKLAFMGDKSALLRTYLKAGINRESVDAIRAEIVAEINKYSPVAYKKVIGVKQTNVTLGESSQLGLLFNQHKVIVLLRDPRDVFCSHLERTMDRITLIDAFGMLLRNLNYYYGCETKHKNVLQVKYESLVAEPKETIRQVLTFLGLDVASYDFSSIDNSRISSNSSYNVGKGKALIKDSGIHQHSIGKYSHFLSKQHCELISVLFYQYLKDGGHNIDLSNVEPAACSLFFLEIAVKTDLDNENFSILRNIVSQHLTESEIVAAITKASDMPKSYIKSLVDKNEKLTAALTKMREANQRLSGLLKK